MNCTNLTADLDVQNNTPTPSGDTYQVHGTKVITDILVNDSDPDGDSFTLGDFQHSAIVTLPQHGGLTGLGNNNYAYTATLGFTGQDSFVYQICDSWGLCTTATVTLNVQNATPLAQDQVYVIRKPIGNNIGSFLTGATDPDGDAITMGDAAHPRFATLPTHGSLTGVTESDRALYAPSTGFNGIDSFIINVCDPYRACGQATVYLLDLGEGSDDGAESCNAMIGEPVNVTNGNMFLHQQDYFLSGVGPAIQVARSYNSNSTTNGRFGRGWSTAYDQSIVEYDTHLMRYNQVDGRAVYFYRIGTSGPLVPATGDIHAQLIKTGSGYTLSWQHGNVFSFNASGKLLSLADRNGNTTYLTYNLSGFLNTVTDTFGRTLFFIPDANGRITNISDAIGTVATYSYGTNATLSTVTYADGSGYSFQYDGNSRLTTVSDALNHKLEAHTYDSQGRAITSERDGGLEHYSLNYVSANRTDVTDSLNRITKYTFDTTKGRNLVTQVEGLCSCGGSEIKSWVYDNQLNITSLTDALGHVISYTYDSAGNRLTETDATGTVTYTHNSFGFVLTRTDQMSGVSTNTYDSSGNLLTAKDALNNTSTYTYDTRGQVLTIKDARNKTTTLTWDTSGRLSAVQDPLSHSTTFGYDSRARVTSRTNALSETTTFEYDAAGRLKKTIFPDTKFVESTYDLGGRRTTVKDARGNETNFAYDAANRLTSITDALNHVTSYGYDVMSNLTSTTDALNLVTNYEYDDFNRLKKTIYPAASVGATRLEEELFYDDDGRVIKEKDSAGRETVYTYDSVDRLTKIKDAALKETQFQYNARSETTAVTDALNQTYSFGYDSAGRATSATRAGTTLSYVYDAAGNRTQRTDFNGAITNYTYDDLNRLTTISYPDSTTAVYGYDNLSRITAATNQNGTVSFSYNNRGQVSSTTDVTSQTLAYGYDENGNRTSLSLGGSAYATYEYDVVNRLKKITDSSALYVDYDYDAIDRLTIRSLPNGVTTNYEYDGLSRLKRIHDVKGAANVADRQYSYNTASQISQLIDPTGTRTFGYDTVDRLTSATGSQGASFGYDDVGNRTSQGSSTYSYGSFNRLSSISGYPAKDFTYDANGNVVSEYVGPKALTFAYDFENRLKWAEVVTPGSIVQPPTQTTVTYKYDALGRRVQRSPSNGSAVNFVNDGQEVIEDRDTSGTSLIRYLNGPGIDNKVRQKDQSSGATYYFHGDQVNSTVMLTDTSGNVAEQISYSPFGETTGSTLTRFGYTGRERDSSTGLNYYRARWYDPEIGRFISEDPIGLGGGINPYSYVENDPIGAWDPMGLQKLRPLGRNGRPKRDLTRAEAEKLMTPKGRNTLPDSVKHNLDAGCIGLCTAYQGSGDQFVKPEWARKTNCYLSKNLAQSRKCDCGERNFVFAVQGILLPDRPSSSIRLGKGGSIINKDLIDDTKPFNYAVWFPSTKTYAYMDFGYSIIGLGAEASNQTVFLREDLPRFPFTMWCSTCRKIK
jgi:RHS repeat-associated protein